MAGWASYDESNRGKPFNGLAFSIFGQIHLRFALGHLMLKNLPLVLRQWCMTFVVAVLLVLALAYPAQYADAYMIPAPHDSSKNNSLDLSAIVQQIEILKESLPVPQIALHVDEPKTVSYTHLTLPTNREV